MWSQEEPFLTENREDADEDLMRLFQCTKLHARITRAHCQGLRERSEGGGFDGLARPPQCNGCEEWKTWSEDEGGTEVDLEVTMPTKEKKICQGCGERKILLSKTHCHKCIGEQKAKERAALREQLGGGSAEKAAPEEEVMEPEIVVDEAADSGEPLPAAPQCAPPAERPVADGLQILFADHPELLEKLRGLAAGEFRSPEQQLLYLVNRAKAGSGLVTL